MKRNRMLIVVGGVVLLLAAFFFSNRSEASEAPTSGKQKSPSGGSPFADALSSLFTPSQDNTGDVSSAADVQPTQDPIAPVDSTVPVLSPPLAAPETTVSSGGGRTGNFVTMER